MQKGGWLLAQMVANMEHMDKWLSQSWKKQV